MKKMSIACSVIAGLFLLGSLSVYSQSGTLSKPKETTPSFENSSPDKSPFNADENISPVNSNTLKAFHASFGNVPNVNWSRIDKNHDRAYFVNDGITVRAGFNRKGKLMYALRYYSEEHLPDDLLLRIKNTYFGRSIFGITEVSVGGSTAYLVTMEDKTTWLKLKIIEDEMTEENILLKR